MLGLTLGDDDFNKFAVNNSPVMLVCTVGEGLGAMVTTE